MPWVPGISDRIRPFSKKAAGRAQQTAANRKRRRNRKR